MANYKKKKAARVIRLIEYEQEPCFTCADNKGLPLCILDACPKYRRWATSSGGKDEIFTADELKARIAFVLMQEGIDECECDGLAKAIYKSFFTEYSAREKNSYCQNTFRNVGAVCRKRK